MEEQSGLNDKNNKTNNAYLVYFMVDDYDNTYCTREGHIEHIKGFCETESEAIEACEKLNHPRNPTEKEIKDFEDRYKSGWLNQFGSQAKYNPAKIPDPETPQNIENLNSDEAKEAFAQYGREKFIVDELNKENKKQLDKLKQKDLESYIEGKREAIFNDALRKASTHLSHGYYTYKPIFYVERKEPTCSWNSVCVELVCVAKHENKNEKQN